MVASLDRSGNDAADTLAVAGAALHQAPRDIVQCVHARRKAAKAVQGMMLRILVDRRAAEERLGLALPVDPDEAVVAAESFGLCAVVDPLHFGDG